MLNINLSLLPLSYLIIFLSSHVLPYPLHPLNVYQDYDLYDYPGSTFDQQVLDWEVVGAIGPNKTTKCPSYKPMLGGPGILGPGGYFMKKYSGLPPHETIRFSLRIYAGGTWQANDSIIVDIDGNSIVIKRNLLFYSFDLNICGQMIPWIYPFWKFNHTSDTAVVKITPQLNNITNTSIGIAYLRLIFAPKESDEAELYCSAQSQLAADNQCKCPTGKYPKPNTFAPSGYDCLWCHEYCESCFGPSTNQCFTCTPQKGTFINGECIKCLYPCFLCGDGGKCLMCENGYWHKWNYTCTYDCPPNNQTIINGVKLSKVPCRPDEYYLNNDTCSKNCSAPFVKYINDYGNFCDSSCPTGQYLYPNNSCFQACKSPLLASNSSGLLKCDFPCPDNQYLYKNGSCGNSCEAPLIKTKVNEVDMCISPCSESQPYFYELNKSCGTSCNPPYIKKLDDTSSLCLSPSSSPSPYPSPSSDPSPSAPTSSLKADMTLEESRQVRAIISAIEVSGNLFGATTILAMVFGSVNPAVSTMAAFVKMLPYIRYININYPPKLQLMLDNLNSTLISANSRNISSTQASL